MGAVLLMLVLLAPLQEAKDYKIRLQAKDGTQVAGTIKLPPSILMKTKFGEIKVDSGTLQYLRLNNDGKVQVSTTTGNTVIGDCSIQSFEVQTSGGKLTVALPDLMYINFEPPAPPPPPPAPPAPTPAPARALPPAVGTPTFKGKEVRQNFDPVKCYARGFEPAILLTDGKRAALLDYEAEECVFVTLATGACDRVKVEGGPSCLVEKDGKVYVANRKSNSLSVIDAAAPKVVGRVAVGASPRWLAAPVLGNVLYMITESDRAWVQSLDTKTGQMLGAMLNTQFNGGIYWSQGFVAVTPDNRLLITQGEQSTSPSATPQVFAINGQKITDLQVSHHDDHPSAFHVDYAGARVYAGRRVYSLDLRETIAGSVPAALCVPHPTKSIVFGIKRVGNRSYSGNGSPIVSIFDELRMTTVAEIDLGADITALLPTETTLYALGRTHLYEVPLSEVVPAEALARERERRIPVDLTKIPSDADIRKAEGLVADGWKALEGGKIDDAKKAFDSAQAADPFSNARVGLAAILVRKKEFVAAVDALKALLQYPFRNISGRSAVYVELAASYLGTNQSENATLALQEGLRLDPKDAGLLKSMGSTYAAAGNAKLQYVCWAKSLQSDPKQPELKKQLDQLLQTILKSTTGVCGFCRGDGKFETLEEIEGGTKKKIITECRQCKGGGKTWKRPCLECSGSGRLQSEKFCEKCWGSGSIVEPAKSNY
jgi:YVTN family beta-propeller protein